MGRVFYTYYFGEVIVSTRETRIIYTFRRHFSLTRNQKQQIDSRKKETIKKELHYFFLAIMLFLDGKQQHFVNIPDWSCEQQQLSQFNTINFDGD